MSNITERTEAPKGFIRDINPAGRGALEPSAASASGILATSDIDPLNHKTDSEEWESTTRPAGAGSTWTAAAGNAAGTATGMASTAAATATSAAATAASMTTGAAKLAYGAAVGNEQMKKEGSEQVWSKPSQ